MYLLDTNVISELRRICPHGAVVAWLANVGNEDLHISAVTIGEIHAGIEIMRDRDKDKAAEIEAWLEALAQSHNVLSMDARIFRVRARLMHHRSETPIEDAMIAATANVHNLIVVTRNTRDFKDLSVRTFNPFDSRTC